MKHAFIATTANGYRGVFMRSSIPDAPKPRGGEQKYKDPIVNLYSISLPASIRNEMVMSAVRKVGEKTFENELARQLVLLTRGK